MNKIFISSPYTIGDVAQNVKRQMDLANELMDHGYFPYVPLLSHFLHINNPRPYEDWLALDMQYLVICDALIRLEGASIGADREIEMAKFYAIPIYYSLNELLSDGKTKLNNGND
jgi:hypothetical protein